MICPSGKGDGHFATLTCLACPVFGSSQAAEYCGVNPHILLGAAMSVCGCVIHFAPSWAVCPLLPSTLSVLQDARRSMHRSLLSIWRVSLLKGMPEGLWVHEQCTFARAGVIVDMKELGVWEPYEVKAQTIKTAVESATLLLRIDDIVSGLAKRDKLAPGQSKQAPQQEDPDAVRAPYAPHVSRVQPCRMQTNPRPQQGYTPELFTTVQLLLGTHPSTLCIDKCCCNTLYLRHAEHDVPVWGAEALGLPGRRRCRGRGEKPFMQRFVSVQVDSEQMIQE